MSTGFGQRLRAEMDQVAVRPRPGLVTEAYRRYRGKRRMMRAVAAAGTALAIAAGTVAVVAAATASPRRDPDAGNRLYRQPRQQRARRHRRDFVHDHDRELRPAGQHPIGHL
jgi:hypothetical protein